MKTKNFPVRKLKRQLRAQGKNPDDPKYAEILSDARDKRTKKRRD